MTISREGAALDATIATGMAPGTYCDLITGGLVGGTCAGTSVVVDSAHAVALHLGPNSAVAIDIETRLP